MTIRTLAIGGILGLAIALTNLLVIGWWPRFGAEALFQQVIREADVAERFGGSAGHQIEDVTDQICGSLDWETLQQLPPSFDHDLPGQGFDTELTRVLQDKGIISACRDGIRHLEIEVGNKARTCKAQVRIWHAGCAI